MSDLDCQSVGVKVSKKTLEDYWKFFTTEEGADILPYAYMGSSYYYNDLIKNCEDYYLCRDEIEILSKNKEVFAKHLVGIECIMEIGPGPIHAVENKSLSIVNSAKDLKLYQGLDYSKSYLKEACNFVKEQLPGIDIKQIEADLMKISEVKEASQCNYKRAIVFLGSTLGNFNLKQQNHIIKEFSMLLNQGDILILTVDTNADELSLLKAYQNDFARAHVKAALEYYERINPVFEKYIDYFDVSITLNNTISHVIPDEDAVFDRGSCEAQTSMRSPVCAAYGSLPGMTGNSIINNDNWYKIARAIEFCFVAKQNFSFKFDSTRIVTMTQGQKLNGIVSYKTLLTDVKKLLNNNFFDIMEELTDSQQKMNIFICKKTH